MRSFLFSPADSDRKLRKGLTSGADVLILDLEDAVAGDGKEAARARAGAFVNEHRGAAGVPPLYVRINDLESGLADADLAVIVAARPDGIMQPKPRSGADIQALCAKIDLLEAELGLTPGGIALLVLAIETPQALLNAQSFQAPPPRVSGYTWGAEDLAGTLGARTNREPSGAYAAPFALARNLCLYAAASAGVAAIDTVYTDFRDSDGLARDAREAARDGFSGKMAIHPDQVPVINDAFTPSAEEIERAQAIVAAFEASPGAGAVGIAGRMVDRPHLDTARRTIERASLAARR